MPNPIIQTNDLESTFNALRNQDPIKVRKKEVPRHSDYKSIPNQNYAPTTSVHGAFGSSMNRYASAGNSGIVYGQPQFFSPVHTPINWQIPSKRLEQYQWLYLPNTQVLLEDFTYSTLENTSFTCKNIIEDPVVPGGFIFEAKDYPKIMNSEGLFNQPPRMSMRDCSDKRCFSFKAIGNHRATRISEEHCIFVLDGKAVRKNRKIIGGKKFRLSRGIKPNGVEKVKIEVNLIKRIQAHEVSKNDYLLTPVPKCGTETIDSDLAWAIGFCIADGCIYVNKDGSSHSIKFTGKKNEPSLAACKKILENNFDGKISSVQHGDGNGWRVSATTKKAFNLFKRYIINKGIKKKFTKDIFNLNKEARLNLLAGYFDGDGCFEKPCGKNGGGRLIANCYSVDMADQIYWLLLSCGISASIGRYPLYGDHYESESDCAYRILVPGSDVSLISKYMRGDKVPKILSPKNKRELKFFYKENGIEYLASPIDKIEEFLYTGKGFDIEMTNDRHALVADGYVCSNSRFFYENEPKIAASIDFYSYFPMNDFENECKDRQVKRYFDKLKNKLDISKWLRLISHEVHLLGDCFPFIEISCEHCGGSGRNGDEICEHEGGTARRIVILNPDYVEVFTSPLNPSPLIALKPDEELINMVQKKVPGYERLTPEVRALVASGKPIRLDNRNVTHIMYGEGGYTKYGVGMVRRLFPILSYKTKLMVAQWIVAERLIVPIKIVKVGSDTRPAGPADIAAVQEQLAQTANDPNLTIVTHHAFELVWEGASGKVLTLSNEFEFINQEILDGMMINNALLNGEGPNFCLSDDTRIMTNHGLKYRKELDIEKDMIATFNKEMGALEYQKAIKKYEYNHDSINGYSKPLKHFLTNRIDMLVTENHRMLYANRKTKGGKEGFGEWMTAEASGVKERGRFRACIDKWVGTTEEKEEYFGINKNDFLQIVGWYISEGNRHIDNHRNGKIYSVDINQSSMANPDVYSKMKTVLSANNICKIYPSSKNSFAISNSDNKGFVSYLVNNCGQLSNQKMIPMDIKNMSKESLKILLRSLVECDGSERPATKKKPTDKKYYSYTTVSIQLRDDVIEILFKLGFSPRFATIKFENKKLQTQYTISWTDAENGRFPVLDSRTWNGVDKPQTKNQVIFDEDYIGKVWCVEVPNHFIITERNGLFGIHGNSNAAVGIEAMIERLQTFRREIANWVEEKIYLPEAKRQGFIDENADSEETEYIYPKVKWNSMHLRDQQQFRTFVLQLYEKGLLSAQTVLEAFDFDPDQEIERKRYDAIQMAALGQGMGGAGGAGGGMPGMGGGGGGMPGLGGGDMGGGMPPMPGMGGGEGGLPGAAPGGEAPISAPPAQATTKVSLTSESSNNADPSSYGGKILKKKTRERIDSDRLKIYRQLQRGKNQNTMSGVRDAKGRIVFTKCERQLMDQIRQYSQNGLIRYPVVPQYEVKFGSTAYPIDFAIPHLKIGVEADGEMFHSSPKQQTHDKERDMKLAQSGWTILRFSDTEIDNKVERVMSEILKVIMQKENAIESNAPQNK